MSKVMREESVESLDDFARVNATMAARVANDTSMSQKDQSKLFSLHIRNATSIRAEQRKTALDLARMGLRTNGQLDALTFNPVASEEKDEAES